MENKIHTGKLWFKGEINKKNKKNTKERLIVSPFRPYSSTVTASAVWKTSLQWKSTWQVSIPADKTTHRLVNPGYVWVNNQDEVSP